MRSIYDLRLSWDDKVQMYELYRDKKGITMQEIAERKGINVSTVYRAILTVRMVLVSSAS